ncbi:hypothetical protein [Prochlorococcus marinus]|uniref:hypothetical protein n=1 Tax=Prochlorococcus marinus TaxID=1219 RepID=UPI001ADD5961|nr:hypothetical protein [Prochlorococcus marinus]MBO8204799.1 hypothetical protein [Prochlorococcus marinus CUG1415]MBW3044081.1 hypothetical protein [Prochlorococcus marinus str. MU1415]
MPYAFNQRYTKVTYQRREELNLNIKDISFVMVHEKEVHQHNYTRFIPTDTFAKFEKKMGA